MDGVGARRYRWSVRGAVAGRGEMAAPGRCELASGRSEEAAPSQSDRGSWSVRGATAGRVEALSLVGARWLPLVGARRLRRIDLSSSLIAVAAQGSSKV